MIAGVPHLPVGGIVSGGHRHQGACVARSLRLQPHRHGIPVFGHGDIVAGGSPGR